MRPSDSKRFVSEYFIYRKILSSGQIPRDSSAYEYARKQGYVDSDACDTLSEERVKLSETIDTMCGGETVFCKVECPKCKDKAYASFCMLQAPMTLTGYFPFGVNAARCRNCGEWFYAEDNINDEGVPKKAPSGCFPALMPLFWLCVFVFGWPLLFPDSPYWKEAGYGFLAWLITFALYTMCKLQKSRQSTQ